MAREPGTRIGAYELRALLAHDDLGELHQAVHMATIQPRSIRLLPRWLGGNAAAAERLGHEAVRLSGLDHPGIAKVFDLGDNDGAPFIVLRQIHGRPLRELLTSGPLPPDRALALLSQLAGALDAAHAHGVTHRDVKPANILVDEAGRLTLIDLGVARAIAGDAPFGTPTYLAPETIAEGGSRPSADLYALGVLAYELLVGRAPFTGASAAEIVQAQATTPPPSPRAIRPDLPPAAEPILLRQLEKDPARRYPTGRAFVEALTAAVGPAAIPAGQPRPAPIPPVAGQIAKPPPDPGPADAGPAAGDDLATGLHPAVSRPVPPPPPPEPTAPPAVRDEPMEPLTGGPPPEATTIIRPSDTASETTILTHDAAWRVEPRRRTLPDAQPADAAAPPDTPPHLDENVQFTVYRPRAVQPARWYDLLAFAHLAERPPGSDEPDPVEEVKRQAAQVLGERAAQYQDVTQDSAQAVPREGELTFLLDLPGFDVNPRSRTFQWVESVHREEFRVRAGAALNGQTARGRLTVFLGRIILAEVALSIRVDAAAATAADAARVPATATRYRRIFPSYSRRDTAVVQEFERYAHALGDDVTRDVIALRSGEIWDDRLRELIAGADIFQLFWSWNALGSEFVRREYEYALGLGRPSFIRPVYWEEPMPRSEAPELPPPALAAHHFYRLSTAGVAPAPGSSPGTASTGATAPAAPGPATADDDFPATTGFGSAPPDDDFPATTGFGSPAPDDDFPATTGFGSAPPDQARTGLFRPVPPAAPGATPGGTGPAEPPAGEVGPPTIGFGSARADADAPDLGWEPAGQRNPPHMPRPAYSPPAEAAPSRSTPPPTTPRPAPAYPGSASPSGAPAPGSAYGMPPMGGGYGPPGPGSIPPSMAPQASYGPAPGGRVDRRRGGLLLVALLVALVLAGLVLGATVWQLLA